MYRSLTESGVLVLNEYSEESCAVRLRQIVRCVRSLRRFFPEVHVLRPTEQARLRQIVIINDDVIHVLRQMEQATEQ